MNIPERMILVGESKVLGNDRTRATVNNKPHIVRNYGPRDKTLLNNQLSHARLFLNVKR
jgi:hypothetical protein